MKTNKNKTDVQCVISFRADKETKKRIESAAKPKKSSKSYIEPLALTLILDEADRAKITLLPNEKTLLLSKRSWPGCWKLPC